MEQRKLMRVLVLVILVVMILGGSRSTRSAQAQTIAVTWSKPINISNTVGCSAQPAVAADLYGNVHVFWSEDTLGRRCTTAPTAGGSIYYSRHSGNEWSFPVDIITTTLTASSPSAVVNSLGRLHLVWAQVDGIYYSNAQSWSAATTKAWSAPARIILARYIGTMLQLAVGPDDSLHLVYSDWGNATAPTDGNVYYVVSQDGGDTWSDPEQVSDIAFGQELSILPRIAIDDQGTVHVVWSTIDTTTQAELAVYYARRGKDNRFFSAARTVMDSKKKITWMMAINVAAVSNQILLTWACGDQPKRCYQVSVDYGIAWSSTQHVFGNLLSLANYDALAVDGDGKVYWVAQLRVPAAMYYSIWDKAQWTDPPTPFITYGVMTEGHAPAVAVGMGNQINLVLVDQDNGDIYYTQGITNAAAVPRLEVPTATAMPTTAAVATAVTPTKTVITPTSSVTTSPNSPLASTGLTAEQLIIILAVIPAILLFAAAIYWRLRSLRRP